MTTDTEERKKLFNLVNDLVQKINKENLKKAYRSKRFSRGLKKVILFIISVHILGIIINYTFFKSEFWDNDKDRGAIAISDAPFGENHQTPEYLDQGWNERESLWFYKTTQGSNLLPYDFYMSLEQAGSTKPFNSNKNISKYQYLIQKNTYSNPDALPVGFTKDTFKGKEYLGFTCAACHTSQINYTDLKSKENKAIRIDGGPAQSNTVEFMYDLSNALEETLCTDVKSGCDVEKYNRFITKVMQRNSLTKALITDRNYTSEEEIKRDLEAFSQSIKFYNDVNKPDTPYGYSRLDAFGRIYNRVVQHVVDLKTLIKVFNEFLSEEDAIDILNKIENITNKEIHLVDTALHFLSDSQKIDFKNILFTKADAPVSYPYLWDIPFHDYLQWNGMVFNSGGGAVGRNVGQVIGVFGTLDWRKSSGFSPSNLLIQKKSVIEDINFHSSINVRNLLRIENQLKKLVSPKWPEEKLGKIDPVKRKAGEVIFKQYCLDCHGNIDRTDKQRRITSHLSNINNVGTDPKMAENSAAKTAYTGILQGSYVNVSVGRLLLQEKAPVALMVTATTENALKTPDYDTSILARWSDWIYDMFFALFENPVEETIKQGDYEVDSTMKPLNSYLSYKARPLNGIWATAPYLHNGSVANLYELLLPAERRLEKFMVGSRVFDKDKVGFKTEGYKGFEFDTRKPGNSNKGHEYAAGRTALPNGKKLPPLNETQRLELLEYMKSL